MYRYTTLFTLIFLSAVIVPLPANTVLLAVGAFITQGYFDFGWAAIVALIANVLGDSVGYFIKTSKNTSLSLRLAFFFGHSSPQASLKQQIFFPDGNIQTATYTNLRVNQLNKSAIDAFAIKKNGKTSVDQH